MDVELIICILLGILLAFSTWMAGEYWKEKEHYRCKEYQDNDDESNILELPSEAPQGAIWPWNGKQYIRIGNTWVQLEEYSINNNYKNKELCTDTPIQYWHSVEERPSKSCPILIYQDDCGEYRVADYCKEHDLVITDEAPDGESWKWGNVFYAVTRWCYIEDLEKL